MKLEGDKKEDNTWLYNLPQDMDINEYRSYWISFIPKNEFEEYIVDSNMSIGLSKKYIFEQLVKALNVNKPKFEFKVKRLFTDCFVDFIINKYEKGNKIIYMCPYYLEEQNTYGFIIDFKFSKNIDVLFDKEVQKLSLSLDVNGRSNKNYYSDKFRIVQNFITEVYEGIQNIGTEDEPIEISPNLVETTVFHLNKKEYIFSNNNISSSQFQGIRNYGAYKNISKEVTFAFIFEDRFRSFANELYLSLTGKLNPGTFPGLEQMFNINNTSVNFYRKIKS